MISESSSAPTKSKLKLKCPKCKHPELTRSRRTNLLERGFSLFHYFPYRCQRHTCKHRFYAFGRHREQ